MALVAIHISLYRSRPFRVPIAMQKRRSQHFQAHMFCAKKLLLPRAYSYSDGRLLETCFPRSSPPKACGYLQANGWAGLSPDKKRSIVDESRRPARTSSTGRHAMSSSSVSRSRMHFVPKRMLRCCLELRLYYKPFGRTKPACRKPSLSE